MIPHDSKPNHLVRRVLLAVAVVLLGAGALLLRACPGTDSKGPLPAPMDPTH